jgi:NAD(P)-dependent dehydrogenase (short-subunit alcohol dehydrogenase family)
MKNVEQKWTAQDIPSQEGRLAVVTGATSGVGFYTAKELARKRATVIMPARDMRKAQEAAERIGAEVPKARLYLTNLDLAEFDSVREFGEHLRQRYGTGSLDLLVNNAGIMALPKRTLNSQGLELQIATNYFGPFLLTALLFPLMKEEQGSRIVTVSSTVARSARLEFDNLQSERRYVPHGELAGGGAYTQSKLADLIFAYELHRRLSAANSCIASIAAHPGWALTDIGRSASPGFRFLMKLSRPLWQSAEAGSLPLLFAATSPDVRKGGYYGPDGRMEAKGNPTAAFEPVVTKDATVGRRLWDESERVTGMQFVVSAPFHRHAFATAWMTQDSRCQKRSKVFSCPDEKTNPDAGGGSAPECGNSDKSKWLRAN